MAQLAGHAITLASWIPINKHLRSPFELAACPNAPAMRGRWLALVCCVAMSHCASAFVSFMEKYHGNHSKAYHRHSYPVIVHNVCSLRAENPVGSDGSVLIRRFRNVQRATSLFCQEHAIDTDSCNRLLITVHGHMKAKTDEYNWILHRDQDGVIRVRCVTAVCTLLRQLSTSSAWCSRLRRRCHTISSRASQTGSCCSRQTRIGYPALLDSASHCT